MRTGHLFQNRYKSIVCEEEPYLLELVRYIHLNPVRAGMVPDMNQLATYRWCGHAVLMGRRALTGQNTDEILVRFGRKVPTARRNYRTFVEGGIARGKRNDLTGGGLKQSLPTKEVTVYDQRILGSGPFVERFRQECEFDAPMPLEALVERLAAIMEVAPQHLTRRTKKKRIADARNVISYVAVRCRGYNGAELARHFNITRSAISTGADRGEHLVKDNEALRTAIGNLTK